VLDQVLLVTINEKLVFHLVEDPTSVAGKRLAKSGDSQLSRSKCGCPFFLEPPLLQEVIGKFLELGLNVLQAVSFVDFLQGSLEGLLLKESPVFHGEARPRPYCDGLPSLLAFWL